MVVVLLLGGWAAIGFAVAPVAPWGWASIALAAGLLGLLLGAVVRGRVTGRYPRAPFRRWVARPLWYALLFFPPLAVAAVAGEGVGLLFGESSLGGRIALLVTASVVGVIALLGAFGARSLVVRDVVVASPDLPAGLDGFRIAQISDVHVGPHTPARFLARIVSATRGLTPDVIAVTGDLVDDFAADVDAYAAGLGSLEAPLGVFAIPGNHDVYAGWSDVKRRLAALPLQVLVNESVRVRRGAAEFTLAGTGDPAGRGRTPADPADAVAPDIDQTLRTAASGQFTVVLAHNPSLWPALASRGVNLTLSGHTHWGQLAIPGLGWNLAGLFLDRSMGAHQTGKSVLYINPGTNHWGIPFRIGALPEITLVTLRHATTVSVVVGRPRVVPGAAASSAEGTTRQPLLTPSA
ncbi:MAG: hypothetical protein NVS4B3_08480 [Gemmatimonadaceae bacterium]